MTVIINGTAGITSPGGDTSTSLATNGLTIGSTALGAGNATRFKNRIINGNMAIDQRNNGGTFAGAGFGTVDRFAVQQSVINKLTFQQNAGSVTPPTGFKNYLGATTTTAFAIGSSDYYFFYQPIEGFNTYDLAFGTADAKTVNLSFWVRSSLTGTFSGSLRNGTSPTRSYPFSYTISSANTWTQISVTIAGDTSGDWLTTNATGITVTFCLGSGSTRLSTANSWQTGDFDGVTGTTSVVGTSDATFYVTGLQLEVGSSATGFEYVDYGTQLEMCQRYYAKMISSTAIASFGSGYVNGSTQALYYIKYPTTMRASPTFSYSSLAIDSQPAAPAVTSAGTTYAGTDTLSIVLNASGGGLTAGQATTLRGTTTTSFVDFSAEL
jgi:hypothetical protein